MAEPPLDQIDALVDEIRGFPDPRRAMAQWKQLMRLLQTTDLPSPTVTHLVGMRDLDGLVSLIDQLRQPASEPTEDAPPSELCQRAYRAFRKRAKLTRLDDESKLGHGPFSKGANDALSAITPPTEYPPEVWAELVRQGKLRYVGHGLYQLPKR